MNNGAFDPQWRLATLLSKLVVLSLLISGWLVSAMPAQESQPSAVLFEDVRIFDGKSAELSGPTNWSAATRLRKFLLSRSPSTEPAIPALLMAEAAP
jgi:hypothetical protein